MSNKALTALSAASALADANLFYTSQSGLSRKFTGTQLKAFLISDTVYGGDWNGVLDTAPSKNAVYDKLEALAGTIPAVSDAAYDATAWNANTDAPSKNAVRDKIESLVIPAYVYGGSAVASITADEILLDHIAVTAHTLPANLVGSAASVGTNPTANPWVGTLKQNGTDIATISITSAGSVTLATVGGTAKAIAAGDVVSFHGPAGADATLARLRFTFKGTL